MRITIYRLNTEHANGGNLTLHDDDNPKSRQMSRVVLKAKKVAEKLPGNARIAFKRIAACVSNHLTKPGVAESTTRTGKTRGGVDKMTYLSPYIEDLVDAHFIKMTLKSGYDVKLNAPLSSRLLTSLSASTVDDNGHVLAQLYEAVEKVGDKVDELVDDMDVFDDNTAEKEHEGGEAGDEEFVVKDFHGASAHVSLSLVFISLTVNHGEVILPLQTPQPQGIHRSPSCLKSLEMSKTMGGVIKIEYRSPYVEDCVDEHFFKSCVDSSKAEAEPEALHDRALRLLMPPQRFIVVADKSYKSPETSKTPEPRHAFEATRNSPKSCDTFETLRNSSKTRKTFKTIRKAPASMLRKASSILRALKIRKTPKRAIRMKCAIKVEYNPDKAFDVATSAAEFARSNGFVVKVEVFYAEGSKSGHIILEHPHDEVRSSGEKRGWLVKDNYMDDWKTEKEEDFVAKARHGGWW
ncbi:hypothetical protein IWZ01DRAFT_540608 [Phyllosticta capitalensis]